MGKEHLGREGREGGPRKVPYSHPVVTLTAGNTLVNTSLPVFLDSVVRLRDTSFLWVGVLTAHAVRLGLANPCSVALTSDRRWLDCYPWRNWARGEYTTASSSSPMLTVPAHLWRVSPKT